MDFQTPDGRCDELEQHRVADLDTVGCREHSVDAEQEERRAVERIHLRMYRTVAAGTLDLANQQHDHRMVRPVVLGGARR